MPDDLSRSMLLSAFDEARLVYFDGMSTETALFVAQEVIIILLLLALFTVQEVNIGIERILNILSLHERGGAWEVVKF